jgi:hypothetical protein
MKGIWIPCEILERQELSPLSKILLAWISNLARGGCALSLPTDRICHILGVERSQLSAAFYQLQAMRLVCVREDKITLASLASSENEAPKRYKLPEGWAVVACSKGVSIIQREEGWGGCLQVPGLPTDTEQEADPALQAWLETVLNKLKN